jgi:hypothetical protein
VKSEIDNDIFVIMLIEQFLWVALVITAKYQIAGWFLFNSFGINNSPLEVTPTWFPLMNYSDMVAVQTCEVGLTLLQLNVKLKHSLEGDVELLLSNP